MPVFQQELREEIQRTSIGEDHDYNSMPLLTALINEVLRLYPAFPLSERVATGDCILPLSQPMKTITGVEISEIPIKKGQCVYVAIASYNRLTSIWGPDAHDFRPSRWLEKDPCNGPALGPHASLYDLRPHFLLDSIYSMFPRLTFFGGPAVCLGWRLAYNYAF
ncbi:cytochrome P450 [Mycena rosella]|uniref:Cytochrome P450 n=1 Tax=Mycena rosella TaxID=1033263 RepID=A0AAD7GZB2_MYCRO|nr:cytochrome P450 [Mycena rosella]